MPKTAKPDEFIIVDEWLRIMPAIGWEDRKNMTADIKKNGIIKPLEVLPDMRLVDGHQRHGIIVDNPDSDQNIPYIVRHDLEGKPEIEIKRYIARVNLFRRHLTSAQKALAAYKLAQEWGYWEEAKESQVSGLKQGDETPVCTDSVHTGRVTKKIAEDFNVSRDAVDLVHKLKTEGEDDLLTEVVTGKKTMDEAWKKLRKKPSEKRASGKIKYIMSQRNGRDAFRTSGHSIIDNLFAPGRGDAVVLLVSYVDHATADKEDVDSDKTWKPTPFKDWTCVHGTVGGCWRCFPEVSDETTGQKKTAAHIQDKIILPIDRKELPGFSVLPDKDLAVCRKKCIQFWDDTNQVCTIDLEEDTIPAFCKKFHTVGKKDEN